MGLDLLMQFKSNFTCWNNYVWSLFFFFKTKHCSLSNLIRSVNKEIERDIERLKLDLWSLFYNKNERKYELTDLECSDLASNIINLPSWNTQPNTKGLFSQSWRPGEERSKVFSGNKVLITRELSISTPVDYEFLNTSVGTLNYELNGE